MDLTDAIQLKALHESHTNSQSCGGCSIDVGLMIKELSEVEKAKELLKQRGEISTL